jgi:hypothetical protein
MFGSYIGFVTPKIASPLHHAEEIPVNMYADIIGFAVF